VKRKTKQNKRNKQKQKNAPPEQGDQIGRTFVHWAVVSFWHFLNFTIEAQFWATFFYSTSYVFILTKHGLGSILGDFYVYKLIWSPCTRDRVNAVELSI
jgi:hypothetical protein